MPWHQAPCSTLIVGRSKGPCDVFDPWVRWESGQLGWDLRIRPAPPAPAASGNPGYTDLAPLGLRSKNRVFELSG